MKKLTKKPMCKMLSTSGIEGRSMGLFDEGHIGRIAGVEFYQSINMVIRDGDKQVKKTLRERFTWKFWETHKTVPNMVPDRTLYKQDGRVMGHPETIREAIRQIEEHNEY